MSLLIEVLAAGVDAEHASGHFRIRKGRYQQVWVDPAGERYWRDVTDIDKWPTSGWRVIDE